MSQQNVNPEIQKEISEFQGKFEDFLRAVPKSYQVSFLTLLARSIASPPPDPPKIHAMDAKSSPVPTWDEIKANVALWARVAGWLSGGGNFSDIPWAEWENELGIGVGTGGGKGSGLVGMPTKQE
jgi:hypothetical protein